MGIWTPKTHITGCLQAHWLVSRRPFCAEVHQGGAASVIKQALAWRAEGKDVWIEIASPFENATTPGLDIGPRERIDPVEQGREDALKGRSIGSNPYLSDAMVAEYEKGWQEGFALRPPPDMRAMKDCPRCYGRNGLQCADAGSLRKPAARDRYAINCRDCNLLGPARRTPEAALVAWNRDSNFKRLKRKRAPRSTHFFIVETWRSEAIMAAALKV